MNLLGSKFTVQERRKEVTYTVQSISIEGDSVSCVSEAGRVRRFQMHSALSAIEALERARQDAQRLTVPSISRRFKKNQQIIVTGPYFLPVKMHLLVTSDTQVNEDQSCTECSAQHSDQVLTGYWLEGYSHTDQFDFGFADKEDHFAFGGAIVEEV